MPHLRETAAELDGKLTIVNLNVDENGSTPGTYGVRSLPTLVMFRNGRVVATRLGALPKDKLVQWIRSAS